MNSVEKYAEECEESCDSRLEATRDVIKSMHNTIEKPPNKTNLLLEQIALSLAEIADCNAECTGQGGCTGSYY